MDNIDEEGSNLGFKCACCIFIFLISIIIVLHEVIKN